MELTTNYKMRKPGRGAAADPADINDLNYNADILDRVVKENVDAMAAHAADKANPHGVTKADVGLASADDTPDAEKPLSAPQKAYIDAVAQEGFGAASITNAMLEKMPALTLKGNDADIPAVPRDLTVADLATLLGSDVVRVVEQGSNANGSYVKYADGRMECWGVKTGTVAVNNGYGTLYGNAGTTAAPVVFAQPFISTNGLSVQITPQATGGSLYWCETYGQTAAQATVFFFSYMSQPNMQYAVNYLAKGRWK